MGFDEGVTDHGGLGALVGLEGLFVELEGEPVSFEVVGKGDSKFLLFGDF